jgi:signal transduction histidine kinase
MSAIPRKWEQSLKELENEFRRLVQALDLIVELDRRIFHTTFDLSTLLEEMLKGLRDLVVADYAQILLRRGHSLTIVHSTQPEDKGREFMIKNCVCGIAVEERRTVSSGNVERDFPDRYQWILGRDERNRMISEVVVPIYTPPPDEIVAGVINIESPNPDSFSDSQIEIIEKFALQAGAAISTSRINTGLALTIELAEHIQNLSQEPNVALRTILKHLCELFQEGVIIQFLTHDRASKSLIIESSTASSTEGKGVLIDDSFSGLVILRGTAVRSNDVRRDYPELFKDTIGDAGYEPTQSELAVPIKEDGRIVGVLNVESPQKDAFSNYDEYMLTLVASNASLWTRIYQLKHVLALEKMATVGNVVGHLIHTLNSGLLPLGKIANNLQQIIDADDSAIKDKIKVQIDWLRSIAPSTSKSINKLRDRYIRAQVIDEININEIAREVVAELATREEIIINWSLDENIPELRFSPGIYDVIWNLVSNSQAAIKEGQEGEITISTKIIYGQYTKQIEAFELCVKDNGEGIPEDKLEQIFLLGYSSREGVGTGYGMWWLQTFIDRYEGKIEIKSKVGEGTNIRLWFPLTPEVNTPQSGENNDNV